MMNQAELDAKIASKVAETEATTKQIQGVVEQVVKLDAKNISKETLAAVEQLNIDAANLLVLVNEVGLLRNVNNKNKAQAAPVKAAAQAAKPAPKIVGFNRFR